MITANYACPRHRRSIGGSADGNQELRPNERGLKNLGHEGNGGGNSPGH
jgi:hypothetical protein